MPSPHCSSPSIVTSDLPKSGPIGKIALLSHIYNMAREWGITEKQNPAAGARKNKEKPRDFYAGPQIWDAVYHQAPPELRGAAEHMAFRHHHNPKPQKRKSPD
ncbi:hypothetical protein D9M71_523700 [compost metagenome]